MQLSDNYKNTPKDNISMEKIDFIIDGLKQVNGLSNFNVLNEGDRMKVLELEEERNIGVIESLKRDVTLVLTHDSGFRKPAKEIVKNGIFPAVPFPEVKAKSVVSSSPNIDVHNYLVNRFNIDLRNNEATLLIGFNL